LQFQLNTSPQHTVCRDRSTFPLSGTCAASAILNLAGCNFLQTRAAKQFAREASPHHRKFSRHSSRAELEAVFFGWRTHLQSTSSADPNFSANRRKTRLQFSGVCMTSSITLIPAEHLIFATQALLDSAR
jgi:hypothetical protein